MAKRHVRDEARDVERFDVVHADILRFFPELVFELGGDTDALFAHVGISTEEVRTGGAQISYRRIIELIEHAAEALHCTDFGMRLAVRQGGSEVFGPLGSVMQNSRTLGEALTYVSNHSYAHSLASKIWQKPLPDEEGVFVGHDILLDRIPNKSQTIEQTLLVGQIGAIEMTGGRARGRRVHFRHQPVSPPRIYRRYFGCDVHFGQNVDGIFFSNRDMASPIIEPDAAAYRSATEYIGAQFTRHDPPLHARVRGAIMRLLATEYCNNTRIARELNLHPRTLHRQLTAEGTSFQRIKDEVRRDTMLYYLRDTELDFAGISEKLGFAEQSVMTRCCNSWFAASPTRVRERARARAQEHRLNFVEIDQAGAAGCQ